MSDYIYRQGTIDAIQELVDKYVDRLDINRVPSMMAVQFGKAEDAKWSAAANSAEKALNIVKAAPPADVEPVRHGLWINIYAYTFDLDSAMCSECKGISFFSKPTKYCPHCHAVMDGGEVDV